MQKYLNPDGWSDAVIKVATSLANLRLQTAPSAVGNALGSTAPVTYSLCLVLGSAGTIGTNAAWYVWDSTSALADNNSTVIKPASPQVGGNPGRWVIVGSTL
jgi:hypothetical protein